MRMFLCVLILIFMFPHLVPSLPLPSDPCRAESMNVHKHLTIINHNLSGSPHRSTSSYIITMTYSRFLVHLINQVEFHHSVCLNIKLSIWCYMELFNHEFQQCIYGQFWLPTLSSGFECYREVTNGRIKFDDYVSACIHLRMLSSEFNTV